MDGATGAGNQGNVDRARIARKLNRQAKAMPDLVRLDPHAPAVVPMPWATSAPAHRGGTTTSVACQLHRLERCWRWRWLVYLAEVAFALVLVVVWLHLDTDPTANPGPGDTYGIAAFWVLGISLAVDFVLEGIRLVHLMPYRRAWLAGLSAEEQALWYLGQVAKTAAVIYVGHEVGKVMRKASQPPGT